MFQFYLDIFLQHLMRNLPWILGAMGAVGVLGWSPLGRAMAQALRDRGRAIELEESLTAQLADLQRTLSEVNERLDVTEQRLLRQAHTPEMPALPKETSAT